SLAQIDNLEDHLEEVERQLIMQALEETRWNRTAAAQRLGLTFSSIRYRLKKLGYDETKPSPLAGTSDHRIKTRCTPYHKFVNHSTAVHPSTQTSLLVPPFNQNPGN